VHPYDPKPREHPTVQPEKRRTLALVAVMTALPVIEVARIAEAMVCGGRGWRWKLRASPVSAACQRQAEGRVGQTEGMRFLDRGRACETYVLGE